MRLWFYGINIKLKKMDCKHIIPNILNIIVSVEACIHTVRPMSMTIWFYMIRQ